MVTPNAKRHNGNLESRGLYYTIAVPGSHWTCEISSTQISGSCHAETPQSSPCRMDYSPSPCQRASYPTAMGASQTSERLRRSDIVPGIDQRLGWAPLLFSWTSFTLALLEDLPQALRRSMDPSDRYPVCILINHGTLATGCLVSGSATTTNTTILTHHGCFHPCVFLKNNNDMLSLCLSLHNAFCHAYLSFSRLV